MTAPVPGARQLALIRAAMLVGVLLFAGVAYALHHQARVTPAAPLPGLQYLPLAASLLALGGIFAMRALISSTSDARRQAAFDIAGWAFGELAAITGIVHFWFTGSTQWMATGILIMLLSLLSLPLPAAD